MFAYDMTFDPIVFLGHCGLILWFSDFALYLNTQLVFLAQLSLRLTGELIVYPCSGIRRPSFTNAKIFSSETAWPIKAKLHVEHP